MIGYFMCLVVIICGVRFPPPYLNTLTKQKAGQRGEWKEIFGFRINKMLNSCISVSILFFLFLVFCNAFSSMIYHIDIMAIKAMTFHKLIQMPSLKLIFLLGNSWFGQDLAENCILVWKNLANLHWDHRYILPATVLLFVLDLNILYQKKIPSLSLAR